MKEVSESLAVNLRGVDSALSSEVAGDGVYQLVIDAFVPRVSLRRGEDTEEDQGVGPAEDDGLVGRRFRHVV